MRAILMGLLLLVAFSVPTALARPDIAERPTTAHVQSVVDGLMKIPEVKRAFESGDTLLIVVNGSKWHGTVSGGAVAMTEGDLSGPTHTLSVDPNAMLSIINAYDRSNTAKLAVKAQYMTARSERASVNLAIGAIARTPLDERLASHEPRVGEFYTFQGCNDSIIMKDPTKNTHIGTYCGVYGIVIDAIGGVVGRVPQQHLSSSLALRTFSLVELRVFDSASFSLSSDLIASAEDAVEEDGEELEEENAKKKAKKAAGKIKQARGQRT